MKYFSCPPVIAYTPAPKIKHSADRKAHDSLFFALKSFFDGLTDEQRAALNATPEAMDALTLAYNAANERAASK